MTRTKIFKCKDCGQKVKLIMTNKVKELLKPDDCAYVLCNRCGKDSGVGYKVDSKGNVTDNFDLEKELERIRK